MPTALYVASSNILQGRIKQLIEEPRLPYRRTVISDIQFDVAKQCRCSIRSFIKTTGSSLQWKTDASKRWQRILITLAEDSSLTVNR